jgi:hypothetical protein
MIDDNIPENNNNTQFILPKNRGKNVKDKNSIKVNANREYNKF